MIVTSNFHFCGNCKDASVLCMYRNEDANPKDYIPDAKYSEHV